MTASDLALADRIIDIGREMHTLGYVAANDGNISARCSDGNILVTPTGVSKGSLSRDMLIKVTLSGDIVEGNRRPSSETKMHLRLYAENPGINAVTHAHPAAATSFAIAGIALDRPIYPEALVTLGTVPVAPYATPGTQEVPDSIAPFAKTHKALLLAHHGVLSWGRDLTEAWYRMESVENYARITMNVYYILKAPRELSQNDIDKLGL